MKLIFSYLLLPLLLFFYQGRNDVRISQKRFAVSLIDSAMKVNAKAVVREQEMELEIISPQKAIKRIYQVITILNTNGLNQAIFNEYYDSFSKVTRIKGTVYDAEGNVIKTIDKDKIRDLSAASGYSIYEDSRLKYIDPACQQFPFTVEYSCEIEYKGLIDYPDWSAYDDYNVSVEKSFLHVSIPENMKLRYSVKNMENQVKPQTEKGTVSYSWSVTGLPALKEESFSPGLLSYTPRVYLAPTDFLVSDKPGNCESWKNLGLWVWTLTKGRNVFPPEKEDFIRKLVAGVSDDHSKAKILYEYMQSKSRYVSIQLGIGGWQPFDAETVDRLAYGDCKALTNYMKSMLDVVGIPSYYTLVKAGASVSDVVSDFPANQFNHAILCVPLSKDTFWLECTSQKNPFGFIGSFTDDRHVLLITENGGVLKKTKTYSAEESTQSRHIAFSMNDDGSGQAAVKTTYRGIQYNNVASLLQEDEAGRRKHVNNRTHLPGFELTEYKLTEHKEVIPWIEEEENFRLKSIGSQMGDRMLVPLDLLNKFETVLPKLNARKSDLRIRRAYTDIDSVSFTIPPGYVFYSKPENVSFQSDFGEYREEVTIQGPTIQYIRYLKMNKGLYPASRYNDLSDFFDKIVKADGLRVVLKRK